MQTNRCGHFSLEVEEVFIPHTAVVIRLPIRRCALAEHMIGALARSEEGNHIAGKLRIVAADGTTEAEGERIRVAFGPDLDVIHSNECTVQRCQESCTPSFRLLLRQFDLEEEALRETEDGCLKLAPRAEEEKESVAK
jgi:hypothetical protein